MLTLLKLFGTFFEIGLFGFGGGYVIIPLIQEHLVKNNWMSIEEFLNLVAIAEVTPGSISVNSATYVGYKVYGVLGSVVATLGVISPSLIVGLLIAAFFKNGTGNTPQNILKFLAPAVIGLILGSGFTIGITNITSLINLLIFVIVLLLLVFTDVNPIVIIIATALIGIVFG
ncbi:MAG TPA: chromate transporter [Defluviitoga sp.]|nr:chromate transporter [Defluviitoga sp.]HOP24333.1 chromate transporter [Defluviitoga sp.]HPZ28677.1 chromate transporter [Defluviitoga sp.]HQD62532.1 chromate transporter [Defluviitoga sp.]